MTVLSLDTKRYSIMCHKGKVSTFSFKISQKVLNFLLLKMYVLFANTQTDSPQLPKKEGAIYRYTTRRSTLYLL